MGKKRKQNYLPCSGCIRSWWRKKRIEDRCIGKRKAYLTLNERKTTNVVGMIKTHRGRCFLQWRGSCPTGICMVVWRQHGLEMWNATRVLCFRPRSINLQHGSMVCGVSIVFTNGPLEVGYVVNCKGSINSTVSDCVSTSGLPDESASSAQLWTRETSRVVVGGKYCSETALDKN